MFERITINRQALRGVPIDFGFLAECLVFYGKVRVIADVETFKFLVRSCGPDELLELMEMGALEIEFFDNITAVATVETNLGQLHDLCTTTGDPLRYPQVSRALFDELAGPSGKGANRMFRRFERVVERSAYSTDNLDEARSDLNDATYLQAAVESVLSFLAPQYVLPKPVRFALTRIQGSGYLVTTNIDFAAVNASYLPHMPDGHGGITPAYLIAHVADTRRDLMVGGQSGSEFALAPVRALAASVKFAEIVARAGNGLAALDSFKEIVVPDVPSIRLVVNSGARTFRDVISLVKSSSKFKEWLQKQGGGEDLRVAYCQDVGHLDWADKLPPKSLRWLLMTAAGLAVGSTSPLLGTALGLALSAGDAFLLDRILKGWKPNQFIEVPLRQFLKP